MQCLVGETLCALGLASLKAGAKTYWYYYCYCFTYYYYYIILYYYFYYYKSIQDATLGLLLVLVLGHSQVRPANRHDTSHPTLHAAPRKALNQRRSPRRAAAAKPELREKDSQNHHRTIGARKTVSLFFDSGGKVARASRQRESWSLRGRSHLQQPKILDTSLLCC